MPEDSSLRRQWILLTALNGRRYGMTLREMVAEANVTERTIRRDLDLFRSVGFPHEETVGDYGRKAWRMGRVGNQPPLSFSFDEAAALYLGRRMLEPLAGTLLWEAAQRAFTKIRATLGEGPLAYLERFREFFHCTARGVSDYTKKAELFDALVVAREDGNAVHLLY